MIFIDKYSHDVISQCKAKTIMFSNRGKCFAWIFLSCETFQTLDISEKTNSDMNFSEVQMPMDCNVFQEKV